MHPSSRGRALTTDNKLIAHHGFCTFSGTVITHENDKCVITNALSIQRRNKFPNQFIHVNNHVAKVIGLIIDSLALGLGIPILAIRGWLIRRMRKHHRIVEEERRSFTALDEIDRIIINNIGTVFTVGIIFFNPVDL